jgi:hypothetical protein
MRFQNRQRALGESNKDEDKDKQCGWKDASGDEASCRFDGVANLDGANAMIAIYGIKAVKGDKDTGKLICKDGSSDNCQGKTDIASGNEVKFEDSGGAIAKLQKARDKIEAHDTGGDNSSSAKGWGTLIGAVGGGAALGLGAGFMAQHFADSSFELEKLKAGDEAVKAWFDTVGSKIKCKVGGQDRGRYGDMVDLK